MCKFHLHSNKEYLCIMLNKLRINFLNSEQSSGVILLTCTALSLLLSNSAVGDRYLDLWNTQLLHKPLESWINEGLMTVFFLLIGLEIKRELYIGELSTIKSSMLPVFAAIGGMAVP